MGWVRKPVNTRLIQAARRARVAEELAHIDYLRAVREGVRAMNQTQVAEELGISQPAVSQTLKTARSLDEIRPGFSGADCEEIIKRHIAGHITKPALIRELKQWVVSGIDSPDGVRNSIQHVVDERLLSQKKADQLIDALD